MAEVEVVVVGAGIVGLACAAALARRGRSVLVLERAEGIARETSARNSEVLHAGLYYPPGSLKAVLCVEGRARLLERARRLGLPHRVLGKLVVAVRPEEVAVLERLRATGSANGAEGLALVEGAEAMRREPSLRVVAALDSPGTGICDAHALALSFAAEAESHGAALVLRTRVEGLERSRAGWRVAARGADGEAVTLDCVAVVNAAGLASDELAGLAGIDVEARRWRLHLCKGDYFSLAPGAPLRLQRLVYPVPESAGLGVHATLDLGGRVRFGPDTEYVERPRYDVDPRKADRFAEAVRRYLPAMRAEWLSPEMAGVRPRLAAPGEGFRDFVVSEESAAGLPGLVNLVGIESPGLTASPAIAERVAELLSAL